MPGCILRVTGASFEVDAFLASTSLSPYHVWRAGEAGMRNHIHKESGFKVDVSAVDGELPGQIKDALAFLRRHQTDLAHLAHFPGVDDKRLDFGWARREVVVQSDYLPPELLFEAGMLGIGIEVSLYPDGD